MTIYQQAVSFLQQNALLYSVVCLMSTMKSASIRERNSISDWIFSLCNSDGSDKVFLMQTLCHVSYNDNLAAYIAEMKRICGK